MWHVPSTELHKITELQYITPNYTIITQPHSEANDIPGISEVSSNACDNTSNMFAQHYMYIFYGSTYNHRNTIYDTIQKLDKHWYSWHKINLFNEGVYKHTITTYDVSNTITHSIRNIPSVELKILRVYLNPLSEATLHKHFHWRPAYLLYQNIQRWNWFPHTYRYWLIVDCSSFQDMYNVQQIRISLGS